MSKICAFSDNVDADGSKKVEGTKSWEGLVPLVDCRSFASAGPTVWNSLPNSLYNPAVGPEQFRRTLKTHLFACCQRFVDSALEVFLCIRAIQMYIYLVTYFGYLPLCRLHREKRNFGFLSLHNH